jgi:OHCU decarboxylase
LSEKSTLDRINELDQEYFIARFGSLFEHSPWVAEEAWESRPFGSVEEMWRAFEDAVYSAPRESQLNLIRAHPDLAGKAAVAGELTQESAREQASAGLDRLSPGEFEAFTRMNREYREKFGLPMVVCARAHQGIYPGRRAVEARPLPRRGGKDGAGRDLQDLTPPAAGHRRKRGRTMTERSGSRRVNAHRQTVERL